MVTAIGKLVRTVGNTKSRVVQTSRQRRGGVTDLAGVDYVAEIINEAGKKMPSSSSISTTAGVIDVGDTSSWENRVVAVTKAVKQYYPSATVNGIAGMIGCFTIESNLESKVAEGYYLPAPIGASEGSWDDPNWLDMSGPAIYSGSYPNILRRGLGLGQWTDTGDGATRHTMLLNFANANEVKWYDMGLQIKFIFEGDDPHYIEVAKRILASNDNVTNTTANFLAQWEGVPGNKLGERIAKAQQAVPLIEKALSEPTETPKTDDKQTEDSDKPNTSQEKTVDGKVFSGLTNKVDKGDFNVGGELSTIQYVVIHHNAIVTETGDEAIAVWLKSAGNNTSAHYEVTKSQIIGCVGENQVAWHSGGTGAITNNNSVGIEHANSSGAPNWEVAEDTILNGAQLVADICKRHNIPIDRQHIVGHNEVTATQCPGGIDLDDYVKKVQEFADGTRTEAPANKGGNSNASSDNVINSNLAPSHQSPVAYFPITISQDLDRFQKWYFKIITEELTTDKNQTGTVPLTDVELYVQARNTAEADGGGLTINLTNIFKKHFPCDWIGNSSEKMVTYPNATPEDGFDIMKAAWDMTDEERRALFSSGQKLFILKAIGNHKITFRNFLKFSHIN